jgi:hypothetical protein
MPRLRRVARDVVAWAFLVGMGALIVALLVAIVLRQPRV